MRGRPVLFLIGPAIVIAVATGILLFRSGSTLAGPIDPATVLVGEREVGSGRGPVHAG